MDLHEIVAYCETKPGANKDFPFDLDTLTMKVGGKMFLLADVNSDPPRINLKCDPTLAEEFRRELSCVTPGYHMNKTHWNTVVVDGSIPDERILWMIDHSYDLVYRTLPRSIREDIPLG
jgi:predicted DNA-binding protein (MmcQ/YjbR family)